MSNEEYNANSIDAVLSGINTQLSTITATQEVMRKTQLDNGALLQVIAIKQGTSEADFTDFKRDMRPRMEALEKFKYKLMGAVVAAGFFGSLLIDWLKENLK